MEKSVNKVILLGNLGKDPDVRYTRSGIPVATFTMATNERFKDKNGELQDRVEWHAVVAWRRLAEVVGEYLEKGSRLYLEGRLQTSSWDDKQTGEQRWRTEIIARDLVLLGGTRMNHTNGHSRERETEDEIPAAAPAEEDQPF